MSLGTMKKITKHTVLEAHNQKPKRKCFAVHPWDPQKQDNSESFPVPFVETIQPIFEAQTGLKLDDGGTGNYCRAIASDEDRETILRWQEQQDRRVFLRNCLSLSIALDFNLKKPGGERTYIGNLEHSAKYMNDSDAIAELANIVSKAITGLPYYKDADVICSVPPHSEKRFNLPSDVTAQVAQKTGKPNVTGGFSFSGPKPSVKNLPFDEKWDAWEKAQLLFHNSDGMSGVENKTIILIDDKYQSGMTIQHTAMKLQEAGACQIYGLNFIKTLSDMDNQANR